MISKMTKYSFVLLNAQRDEFLEKLQSLGLVDITRSSKAIDSHSENLVERIEAVKAGIAAIKAGRDSKTRAAEARLAELTALRELLSHYGEFDPARLNGLGVEVNLVMVPKKKFGPELEQSYNLQVLDEDKLNVYAVVFGPCEGMPGECLGIPERSAAGLEPEIAELTAQVEEGHRRIELRKKEIPHRE